MQGKLHNTKNGWTVTYVGKETLSNGKNWVKIKEIPLIEEQIDQVSQYYLNDEYEIICIECMQNVKFDIVLTETGPKAKLFSNIPLD